MNVKIGRIKMRLLAAKLAQNPKKVAPLSIFSISNSRYFASEAAVRLEPDCETPKTLLASSKRVY